VQIDNLFQNLSTPPALHVIVEPHRDVLAHMKEQGWYDKKGVSILEGKWQDCITSEALQGFGKFDVIYTDTFSENYSGKFHCQPMKHEVNVFLLRTSYFFQISSRAFGGS
jgi:hypothetical protein